MDLVEVGYVARPHGVRGELRVIAHNRESTTLTEVDSVHIGTRRFELVAARPVKGAFLLRLEGLDDRDRAEELRGQPVLVRREQIALDAGELLLADLVGCRVVLADGRSYGVVVDVECGPQDRLVIHQGSVERLLPVVPEFVIEVDLEAGTIVVAPPEELPESPVSRSSGKAAWARSRHQRAPDSD